MKKIYPEKIPNSFKSEPVTKSDIKIEIQKLNLKKIVNIWLHSCYNIN